MSATRRLRGPATPRSTTATYAAERCVPDHDRPHRGCESHEGERRTQGYAGEDSGQRQRKDEQERDRLSSEEAEAGDRRRGHRPEDEGNRGRDEGDLHREPERVADLLVVPGDAEPVERPARDRPALNIRAVEGVERDQDEWNPEERDHQRRQDAKRDASTAPGHSASNAPRRFAIRR